MPIFSRLSFVRDYCWMQQNEFHMKYHLVGVAVESSTCGKKEWQLTCAGIPYKDHPGDGYYEYNTPLRNAFDRWGVVPLLGAVTGLGRWIFGTLAMGVGMMGRLGALVHQLVMDFSLIPCQAPSYQRIYEGFFQRGALEFWQGALEVGTLGCHFKLRRFADKNLPKINRWVRNRVPVAFLRRR